MFNDREELKKWITDYINNKSKKEACINLDILFEFWIIDKRASY